MKKYLKFIILIAVLTSCNRENDSIKESHLSVSSIADNKPAKRIRKEYWPLETDVTTSDTTVHSGGESYKIKIITKSLNDSAAIHRATDELGEIIVHAHNRVSEITIQKNDHSLIKSTLTRDIFKGRDEFDELTFNNDTNFIGIKNDEFFFQVGACVPDSDVCDAAEVAINGIGQVRIIKYLEDLEE